MKSGDQRQGGDEGEPSDASPSSSSCSRDAGVKAASRWVSVVRVKVSVKVSSGRILLRQDPLPEFLGKRLHFSASQLLTQHMFL